MAYTIFDRLLAVFFYNIHYKWSGLIITYNTFHTFCILCLGCWYQMKMKAVMVQYWSLQIIMAALCNRADHYIFALWFLLSSSFSSFFFSSSNLSCCRLDVCHTSTHGVALVRIEDARLKRAARGSLKNTGRKNSPKIANWAPSHNFVGL